MNNEGKSEIYDMLKPSWMFIASSVTFVGALITAIQAPENGKNPALPMALTLMAGSLMATVANGVDICRSMMIHNPVIPESAPMQEVRVDDAGFADRERSRRREVRELPEISVIQEDNETDGVDTYSNINLGTGTSR